MNRRVLDLVSMQAIEKFSDDATKKQICETFGEGTLVKDAKTPICKIEKSKLGVPSYSLSKNIRNIMVHFSIPSKEEECCVVDSKGVTHIVSSGTLNVLKAICIFRVNCHPTVSYNLGIILNELCLYFENDMKDYKKLIYSEDADPRAKNILLEYCRQEVFNLLSEEGLKIG